jgi:hypothetical protein
LVLQLLYNIYDDNWNEATFLCLQSFSNLISGCWLDHEGLRGLRKLTAGACLCRCRGKCCALVENTQWATAGWDKADASFHSHNLNNPKTKQWNTRRSQQNGRGLIIGHQAVKLSPPPVNLLRLAPQLALALVIL